MSNKLPFILNTRNPLTEESIEILEQAYNYSKSRRNEFITPEHLLFSLLENENFVTAVEMVDGSSEDLKKLMQEYLDELDVLPEGINYSPEPSIQLVQLVAHADRRVDTCGKTNVELPHLISEMIDLNESYAGYQLGKIVEGQEGFFLNSLIGDVDVEYITFQELEEKLEIQEENSNKDPEWKNMVICVNDTYKNYNPLIGREEEMNKTIRVLCRKDKNNPLHIGEPGVGKTAMVYGLARKIEEGDVPPRLQGTKIYRIDLGNLIAGTQFRGDFEKKIKKIMDGVVKENNPIVYIDEIHNLVGAGATGEGSLDASNFLKPYLERGDIRFIGSTTYDEYKRHFVKSKGIVRRFTNIDIVEPTVEETIHILKQLQPLYEEFHNVKFTDEAIDFAAKGSAKHINDRFLPDKAIDILDESGAQMQMDNQNKETKTIDKELVSRIISKICKVESLAISEEDPRDLENLEKRISTQLFGQEKAVNVVSESVLMSKAGLEEENKPLASLLFVGPTGVGKTELAKLLAKELGVELLRFDMSEYTEKHTVAKLIGSPAGYVGYEDGGLLTDAIRKSPNVVLLLDEIEKAHPDIFNILLQVMDYAKLTDNKGNKADFRNVVLIMTSNAGAQYAAQANVGFNSQVKQGEAMMKQIKKTFKPEFLNRLSATVVFNDMSKEMASKILEKKLNELANKLEKKKVEIKVSSAAKEYLLEKGFTREYGARELDRVIQAELKRLLMKEILFGVLKDGGKMEINVEDNSLTLCKI